MNVTETFYAETREHWRSWLEKHHQTKSEIWLVSYRVRTNRVSVPYHEAVEEALCFAWIDSTRKALDQDSYAQRFTPRRPGSGISQANKERLARLIKQGKVLPSVLEALGQVRPQAYEIPDDIRSALQANSVAWEFFQSTSPAYQRIRSAYVDHARSQPGEFEKRLKNLVEKSAQRKHFGYGIEDFF